MALTQTGPAATSQTPESPAIVRRWYPRRPGVQLSGQAEASATVNRMAWLLMNTAYWADASHNIVEGAAVVVAGFWAWWKFVKGRTFHRRAELELESEVIEESGRPAVRVRATMKNTGSAKIPIRTAISIVSERDDNDGWHSVGNEHIFEDHQWLESGETISDEVLVALTPPISTNALQVRCRVYTSKWKLIPHKESDGLHFRKSTAWTRNVVLPVALDATEGAKTDA